VNACASPKLDLHENNRLAPWHVPVMQRTFMARLINDNHSLGVLPYQEKITVDINHRMEIWRTTERSAALRR
jgi:hypothetical protein